MEVFDAFATPLVAALAVFIVHFLSRGRFQVMDARLDGISARLDEVMRRLGAVESEQKEFRAEVSDGQRALRAEITSRMDRLAEEMAIMRSDLTHVALAVGAREKPNAS